MAKDSSIYENTKTESIDLFITEALLKGETVIIPDFGHLELKTLGDRRTVLFKSSNEEDSFLQVMSVISGEKENKDTRAIYNAISIPLKEEKVVNLPQIGLFRPVKGENGEIRVSFIPSSSLRKLLNNDSEKVGKIKVEEIKNETNIINANDNIYENKDEVKKDEILNKADEVEKSENPEPRGTSLRKEVDVLLPKHNYISPAKREPQVNKVVEPLQDDDTEKSRGNSVSGILLIIAAVIAFIVIVMSTIHYFHNKKIDEHVELILPETSINLPLLAEQHYGNSAFWIYIYEANKDKLTSPINIPKNVSLVIPDLKTDYNVDITDSMEIQRANILTDIVLNNEKKNLINK